MRLLIRGSFGLVVMVTMFGALGCNMEYPIDVKLDWSMKQNEMKWYDHEGSIKQRKINVTVKSSPSGSVLAVAVIPKDQLEATKEALRKGAEPPLSLAYHPGGDVADMTVVIAPKTPFSVVIRNNSDEAVSVDVKIKSK